MWTFYIDLMSVKMQMIKKMIHRLWPRLFLEKGRNLNVYIFQDFFFVIAICCTDRERRVSGFRDECKMDAELWGVFR